MVGFLKMATGDVKDLAPLADDFAYFMPTRRFSLTELKGGLLQVDFAGAGKTMETTTCSAGFVKSIIEDYGYMIQKEELCPGTIRLLAEEIQRTPSQIWSGTPRLSAAC